MCFQTKYTIIVQNIIQKDIEIYKIMLYNIKDFDDKLKDVYYMTGANNTYISIAIDGPSGSGKSSLAKMISKELGFIYIDTGSLYRSIGLYVRSKGIDKENIEEIINCLPEIDLSLSFVDGGSVPVLNGKILKDEIRTPEIAAYASDVSKIPQVRTFLLDLQRNIALTNNVIMDGRDIGTVILPQAQVKIFLIANDETRAERRFIELSSKGINVSKEEIYQQIVWRDKNDSTRKIAPAIPADDAILLDNSLLDINETFLAAMKIIQDKVNLENV